MLGKSIPISNNIEDIKLLFNCIGELPLNKLINSPLRTDNKPSFFIHYNDNGKIYWIDYATGEYGGVFSLIKKYYNLENNNDVIELINSGDYSSVLDINKMFKTSYKKHNYDIKIKIRELNLEDINYWESYGIDPKKLEYFRVFPISHYYLIDDNEYEQLFSTPHHCYAYAEYVTNKWHYKLYQPFNTSTKWTSNIPFTIWDLWSILPQTGETLIITKSRKDAMCIMCNSNYYSVCMQSEKGRPSKEKIDELKNRFNKIYIWYDNDFNKKQNWGRQFASTIAEEFNLIQIEIPDGFESKDISDFYKDFGKNITKNLIKKLLNE